MVCLPPHPLLFLKKDLFINLFLAVLGLCCCTWIFSSYGGQGLLFASVCELLIMTVFLAAELCVQSSVVVALGLSSCNSLA